MKLEAVKPACIQSPATAAGQGRSVIAHRSVTNGRPRDLVEVLCSDREGSVEWAVPSCGFHPFRVELNTNVLLEELVFIVMLNMRCRANDGSLFWESASRKPPAKSKWW